MAFTEFGTNDARTNKRWSNSLMRESFGRMDVTSLFGKSEESCIRILPDLESNPGDTVYYDLLSQDRSNGVNGDSRLDGYESELSFYQDTLKINQKRHGHTFKGMSQQRIAHDLRRSARLSLSNWWGWFMEAGLLSHLAGVAGTGNETVSGALGADTGSADFAGNTITALDSDHLVDGTGATMTLELIDSAVAKAKVNNPRVAPLNIRGMQVYVLYLHPYQIKSLKTETTAISWNEIHREASSRGDKNPIFTGAHGMYNGVIIRESEFIPRSGTNVTHGVLLGQGAGAIAFGNAWKKGRRASSGGGAYFSWREKLDDYDNEEGVAGASCLGFKRTQFNSEAFGVVGVRTTEAAP